MFVLLVVIAVLVQASSLASAAAARNETTTNFHFPSFTSASCSDGSLICTGSVTSSDGFLSLTSELSTPGDDQVGRVLFKLPLLVWPAHIETSFTFRIIPSPSSPGSGGGMAFIMASNDNSSSPTNSYGSYLGIMDPSSDGSAWGQLAVEFDTYKNNNSKDIDGNHVAIETKSVANPLASVTLNGTGIDLKSGRDINVQIWVDGKQFLVLVEHPYEPEPNTRTDYIIFNETIDISKVLPSTAYVGFTASTGAFAQRHQLLNWRFSSWQR